MTFKTVNISYIAPNKFYLSFLIEISIQLLAIFWFVTTYHWSISYNVLLYCRSQYIMTLC